MTSMIFLVNDSSTEANAPVVRVSITQNSNGTLTFVLTQLGGYVGDLRGLFFDVADASLVGTLVASGSGLTDVKQADGKISDLGGGTNLNGLLGTSGGYDVGVEIGSAGLREADDVRSFTFVLDSTLRDLTLADFSGVNFGARVTSVGLDANLDGVFESSRSISAKTGEVTFQVAATTSDAKSVVEDTTASGNVLTNDGAGALDVLTVTGWSGGALGEAQTFAQLAGAKVTLNANGNYTVDTWDCDSLAAGQSVSKTFTYDVLQTNAEGTTAQTVSFQVTVTGINDAPTSANDSVTFDEDTAVTLTVGDFGAFSDVDAGDSLKAVQISTLPVNGALKLDGVNVTAGQSILVADITANKLVYTPAPNDESDEALSFKVVDQAGADSPAYTLTLDITPVADNLAPTDLIFTATSGAAGNSLPNGVFGQLSVVDPDGGVDPYLYSVASLTATTLAGGAASSYAGDITVSSTGAVSASGLDSDRVYELKVLVQQGAAMYDETFSIITGTNAGNTVSGAAVSGDDVIFGLGDNDIILAGSGNDTIFGQQQEDEIHGGEGSDTLTGGGGNDRFYFDTALGASNVDTITDFDSSGDRIYLKNTGAGLFGGITVTGILSAAAFDVVGSGPEATSNTRIIYDPATGGLFYDADGAGGTVAVQIAILGTTVHPTSITAAHFEVI